MVYVIRGYGSERDQDDFAPLVISSFETVCNKTKETYEEYFGNISLKKVQELLSPLKEGTESEVWIEGGDPEDGAFIVNTVEILD